MNILYTYAKIAVSHSKLKEISRLKHSYEVFIYYLATSSSPEVARDKILNHFNIKSVANARFKMMKSRVEDKLDEYFLPNQYNPEGRTFSKKINNINYELYCINILTNIGVSELVIHKAERLIKKSLYYDHLEASLQLSQILYNKYALINMDIVKYEKYKTMHAKLTKQYDMFFSINNLLTDYSLMAGLNEPKNKLINLLDSKINYAHELLNIVEYYKYYTTYTIVVGNYYRLTNQTKLGIKYLNEVRDIISKKPYSWPNLLTRIEDYMLELYMSGRNFDKIEESISVDSELSMDKYTSRWYYYKANRIRANLLLKNYKYAFNEINIILNNSRFRSISKAYREYYYIIYLYCDLLNSTINKNKHIHNPYKYLNDITLLSRNKTYFQFNPLIIEIVYILKNNKYSKFLNYERKLNYYKYTYFKTQEFKREKIFIDLLKQIAKNNFNPYILEEETKDKLLKLKKKNEVSDIESTEAEFVPYDHIWDMIIKILKSNLPPHQRQILKRRSEKLKSGK